MEKSPDIKVKEHLPAETRKEDLPNTKKPSRLYLCFVAVSIVVACFVIWISLTQNQVNISDLWSGAYEINLWYIICGAVAFLYLAVFLEAARIQILIRRVRKKLEPAFCIKSAMLGRCYDLLTPLMLGGKPYQIAYYYSRGVGGGDATSVALSDFVGQKLGFSIMSVFVLIFMGRHISTFSDDTVFMGIVYGGMAVMWIMSAIVLFISLNERVTCWVAKKGVYFAAKIRLVKNKDTAWAKADKSLAQYRTAFRNLVRNPLAVAGVLLLTAGVYFSYACIVFSIYSAFFGFDLSLFPTVLLAVVLFEYIMGVVPLPGGTGGVEIAFFTMFTVLFDSQIGVAFLIWKMITFILPILNGLIVTFYDALWGNKKNEKLKMKS